MISLIARAFLVTFLASRPIWALPPSADVSLSDLSKYQQPPPKTWGGIVNTFLEGKDSLMGTDTKEMAPANEGFLAENKVVAKDNANGVKYLFHREGEDLEIERSEPPFELPELVQHWILRIDVHKVLQAAFPEDLDYLRRYVENFDFYGSYGLSSDDLKNIRLSDFAHPGDYVWPDPVTGHQVTREEGVHAITEAGAHINKYLKNQFSKNISQVVWNRSPERYRAITQESPDQIQVIVRRNLPTWMLNLEKSGAEANAKSVAEAEAKRVAEQ